MTVKKHARRFQNWKFEQMPMTGANPIPWTTADILEATGGELLGGDLQTRFAEVCIDSRKISAGDLFVAIIGDVHDGHRFAGEVVAQGVGGLVVNKNRAKDLPVAEWQAKNIACIAVDNTTRALGDLAAFNRRRTQVSVVAITGSNGKTTTRQLTVNVVASRFSTLAPIGNYNNEIGVPLTLLRLNPGHQWAVLELGTNRPGEIARLAEICTPDIGVITNIGPAHLEGLGSLNGVQREKGTLLEKLKPDGRAVLNADDPRVRALAPKAKRNAVLFGLSPDAPVRAEAVKEKAAGVSFDLVLPADRISIDLKIPGRFMIPNALAAAAVGHLMGLTAFILSTIRTMPIRIPCKRPCRH
jgi:UDP-N-acetylmuramoyl-tripeptide--D-alanyl-D-alanine ligase